MINLARALSIYSVLLRYGLTPRVVGKRSRWLYVLACINPCANRTLYRGQAMRAAFIKLGPIFVKFGQVLSTRPDLFSKEISRELATLQDQVPPFSEANVKTIIQRNFHKPAEAVFATFSYKALASASVAQVHAATLRSGEAVIVKLVRPNIEKTIRQDLSLMRFFAKLVDGLWRAGRRLRLPEMVNEFEATIIDELDMQREAANASQLRRNFIDSTIMYVPKVYWDYCTAEVLVAERIYGINIADIGQLKKANVNLKRLAEHGVEIFFTQVFRDGFFHADMHPGNLFVDASNLSAPKYMGVDFGIMGTLGPEDQRYIAENLLAFFKRDYRRVAELHVQCGWVPEDTRVDQFESAIRTVSEPIFEKPLKDISFAKLLLSLFRTAERFKMPMQPQLMLLQKTLFNIEGLGRELYPELDLWKTAQPFLERWLKDQFGIQKHLKVLINDFPRISEKLLQTPALLHEVLFNLETQQRHQRSQQRFNAIDKNKSKWPLVVVSGAVGLVVGLLLCFF